MYLLSNCKVILNTYIAFLFYSFSNDFRIQLYKILTNPPHLYVCPKSWLGFPTPNFVLLFMCNEFWWEVIVDIGGIVDHHCLSVLLIIVTFSMTNSNAINVPKLFKLHFSWEFHAYLINIHFSYSILQYIF